jgi:hypothetical protein
VCYRFVVGLEAFPLDFLKDTLPVPRPCTGRLGGLGAHLEKLVQQLHCDKGASANWAAVLLSHGVGEFLFGKFSHE